MQRFVLFRKATIDDIELLQCWDTQPHVIASDPNSDWEWEEDLTTESPHVENLIAMLDEWPIGFVQIIDPAREETHYWGKDVEENLRAIDIWIGEPDMLNQGYGTQIMKQAIERCFANPDVKAIINDPLASNKDAIRFYKRLGFEFVEYRTFGEDECMVMKLDRSNYYERSSIRRD